MARRHQQQARLRLGRLRQPERGRPAIASAERIAWRIGRQIGARQAGLHQIDRRDAAVADDQRGHRLGLPGRAEEPAGGYALPVRPDQRPVDAKRVILAFALQPGGGQNAVHDLARDRLRGSGDLAPRDHADIGKERFVHADLDHLGDVRGQPVIRDRHVFLAHPQKQILGGIIRAGFLRQIEQRQKAHGRQGSQVAAREPPQQHRLKRGMARMQDDLGLGPGRPARSQHPVGRDGKTEIEMQLQVHRDRPFSKGRGGLRRPSGRGSRTRNAAAAGADG